MPRLTEQYVQCVSLGYLKEYYKEKYKKDTVFAKQEVVVRKRFGGGRAEGLISFRDFNHNIFTVSLEAKSCKTLCNITFWYDDIKRTNHGFFTGFIAIVISLYLLWDFSWYIKWTIPFIMFFILTFVYCYITAGLLNYKAVDVIRQIERYPATNEKWIALSTNSYNKISVKDKKTLHKKCKNKNIGLILVSPGGKVRIEKYPQYINTKFRDGDYLKYYCIGSEKRKTL